MTSPTTKLTASAEAVLAELRDDHADLWKLLWIVKAEAELDEAMPKTVRQESLAVIAALLEGGYVHPGAPRGRESFSPWPLDATDALARIEREWDALGRDPDIGEIAWFDLTDKGQEYIQDGESVG